MQHDCLANQRLMPLQAYDENLLLAGGRMSTFERKNRSPLLGQATKSILPRVLRRHGGRRPELSAPSAVPEAVPPPSPWGAHAGFGDGPRQIPRLRSLNARLPALGGVDPARSGCDTDY